MLTQSRQTGKGSLSAPRAIAWLGDWLGKRVIAVADGAYAKREFLNPNPSETPRPTRNMMDESRKVQ